jgi:hypothetical protein
MNNIIQVRYNEPTIDTNIKTIIHNRMLNVSIINSDMETESDSSLLLSHINTCLEGLRVETETSVWTASPRPKYETESSGI